MCYQVLSGSTATLFKLYNNAQPKHPLHSHLWHQHIWFLKLQSVLSVCIYRKKKGCKMNRILNYYWFFVPTANWKTKRWKGERNGGEKEEAPLNGATGKVINSCRWRDNNHWESVHFKLKVFRIDTYIAAIVSSTFFFFFFLFAGVKIKRSSCASIKIHKPQDYSKGVQPCIG